MNCLTYLQCSIKINRRISSDEAVILVVVDHNDMDVPEYDLLSEEDVPAVVVVLLWSPLGDERQHPSRIGLDN